jgi:hypothetical protein
VEHGFRASQLALPLPRILACRRKWNGLLAIRYRGYRFVCGGGQASTRLRGVCCGSRDPGTVQGADAGAAGILYETGGESGCDLASVLAIGTHVAFLLWNPQLYVTGGPMWLIPFPIRSYLLSLGPVVLCLAIGIPALLAAVAISLWEERSSYRWGLLAYLYAILLPPAVLNLVHKSIEYSDVIKGLGFWEGGMWIMGCLPITALVLAAVWPAPEFQVSLTSRTRFSNGASLVAPLSSAEWK